MDTDVIGGKGYIGSALGNLPPGAIVLLAAHSSVRMCENDPLGGWMNNVEFFRTILDSITFERFIYASSATVYDGLENPSETINEFNLTNLYNLTKHTIDNIASLSKKEYYGLRFATVCGWSPNLRIDVMLNKMVYDARTFGKIQVLNPQLRRPILGINDLRRAIIRILESDPHPGIYNLASFSASVIDMATYVGQKYGVPVEVLGGESHYAYGLDTSKFEQTYDFKFEDTLESIVESLDKPFLKVGIRA